MEQKRNTHIRKSRYSPKVTEEHTVHPEMTERQKLKKSLSETQNEKKTKNTEFRATCKTGTASDCCFQTSKPPQEEKIPSETTV